MPAHGTGPAADGSRPDGAGPTPLDAIDLRAEPLEVAGSQLALYARDLEQAMEAERAEADQLAAANARLLLLDRLESGFLSFLSHELRTPLNALSAVDLFDPEGDPADQREIVELMREGTSGSRASSEVACGGASWVRRTMSRPPQPAAPHPRHSDP